MGRDKFLLLSETMFPENIIRNTLYLLCFIPDRIPFNVFVRHNVSTNKLFKLCLHIPVKYIYYL